MIRRFARNPMSSSRLRLVLLIACLAGCKTRLAEFPDCVVTIDRPQFLTSCRQQEKTPKVDLLLMIDNSTSMDAMQSELRARFAGFLQVFHQLAAMGTFVDLHIGVVTSD